MDKKIILGGWSENELDEIFKLSNDANFITVNNSNLDNNIFDILEGNLNEKKGEQLYEKIIIFHKFSKEEVFEFIKKFKKLKLQSPIFAVVTQHSINWKLNYLLEHLIEEREFFRKRKKDQ